MGWGDELMAAGEAREAFLRTGKKVQIVDAAGRARTHEAWRENPYVLQPKERAPSSGVFILRNGPNARPYIQAKSDQRWTWRDYRPIPGDLFFTADEVSFAAALDLDVVVEPWLKSSASPNKAWGRERWERLVRLLRSAGREPVQLGPKGTPVLAGARLVETKNFRYACAALSKARAAILPEGGLHHAAAALRIPAVVIYGGYISPRQTGYDGQVSFFVGEEPCGMRVKCRHCEEAMSKIAPEAVFEAAMRWS